MPLALLFYGEIGNKSRGVKPVKILDYSPV